MKDSSSVADELLDELLPEDLDWEELVCRYPRSSLVAAAAAGFWLGYRRGSLLLSALGAFAAAQVASAVNEFVSEEE